MYEQEAGGCQANYPGIFFNRDTRDIQVRHCADDISFMDDTMKWSEDAWHFFEIGQKELENGEYWIYFRHNGLTQHQRINTIPKGNVYNIVI